MIVALLVVALAIASQAATLPPPVPSIESGNLHQYVQDHGKSLFEGFSRVRLSNVHPGGASAVKRELVEKSARSMFHNVATMSETQKFKYLTGMHRRATEADARGEWQ